MAAESSIGKQIREVLATSLKRDPSSVKPEHNLRDDLGLDSLMTFELLYDLEKAFDIEIPNDDLPGLQTLADVVHYIEERMNLTTKKSGPKAKEKKPSTAKPAKAAKSASDSKSKPTTSTQAKKLTPVSKPPKSKTTSKPRTTAGTTKRASTPTTSQKRTTTLKPKVKKK